MTPRAIYSKSGKGVQEASGKTSNLSRADRAVLSAFDGKVTVGEVAERVGRSFDAKFEQLVQQLEKDGYIREVSSGAGAGPAHGHAAPRPAAPARPGAAPATPGPDLDFTAMIPTIKPGAPAAPPVDLAAKARAEAERKAKEEEGTSYKARQEAEARAKAEAEERAKAAAQARAQAEMAARAKAETQARERAEAEAKAKAAEADRIRAEADAKVKAAKEAALRLAADAKARAEAEVQTKLAEERAKAEEAARVRRESEEKARREAEEKGKEADELRQRLEEERRAREEAERKAKEAEERRRKDEEERKARAEAERKAKEADERRRKEEDERRRKDDEERRAREEAERKAREAEERRRKEEDERRRREDAERRAREEAERKAKEAEERRRKEEDERRRKEEEERRARDEADRKAKEAEDRRRKEEEERRAREREQREREDRERREREDRERREREERARAEGEAEERRTREAERDEAPAKPADSFADNLLADLDSFTKRDEEERKMEAESERRAKAEAERRAKEEEERLEREQADRKAREQVKRAAKEAERQAKEAAERERREAEAAESQKARDALSERAKESARQKAEAAPADEDIGITDEDLDMDEVKRDEETLSKQARRATREREREKERPERERERGRERRPQAREAHEDIEAPAAPARIRRPVKWGKPAALVFFLLLVGGVAALHLMPVSTVEYERAASEALGVPVKIGTAHISLLTGIELKMDNVSVGPAKIARVHAHPDVGALFGPKKTFSSLDLEDATIPQPDAGEALFAKARGANFEVRRLTVKNLRLTGPLSLPTVDADVRFGADGEPKAVTLTGADSLVVNIKPSGDHLEFDLNAAAFTVPVASELALSQFGMKGTADRQGIDVASWTASLYEGVINGSAKVGWNGAWTLNGVVTARGVNAAVFAPALVSEGKVEGSGKFSMSGIEPAKLASRGRLEGSFTVEKGVLGSIDISRALSTGGRQASGRTPFTELAAQGVYDKGGVAVHNVNISAGALSAGAVVEIAPSGALSGRIVADVKTASQTLRATLAIGGTVQEPQVKN